VKRVLLAAAAAIVCATPARADLFDWSVSPLTTDVGNAQLTIGGSADGSVYSANQPNFPGLDESGATGFVDLYANLVRTYDTGMVLAFKTSFELYHDRLSVDNYGGDLVQTIYGSLQTGLGRLEIGMNDGAAYAMAVTGPEVDSVTSIDNPNTTFFLDPTTGQAFNAIFEPNSAVEATLNYAKISYYTPRLFGVAIGASFTPNEGKGVLPFIKQGPQVPNRQRGIWEIAINYQGQSGRLSYGLSGAIALAHAGAKTPGHHGLTDWAFGAEADYDLSDEMKLSFGGAYRQTNQYTFDINNALAVGGTRALHASTTLTYGSWIAGGEYETGSADGSLGLPNLGLHAYQVSAGYVINTNMQLTGGWQQQNYSRSAGVFYNGAPKIDMEAWFLHLNFHI